jgi:predicted ATPase
MHLQSLRFHPDQYPTRDHYPFNLGIFHEPRELAFSSPVTFFVGENGTGKSTLLEAVARRAGIHIWRDGERTRCVVNRHEDKFYRGISLQWVDGPVPGSFFGSSIFQDFARLLDEWAAADPGQLDYFGGQSLLTQSHGQSLMSFFKARYAIRGLYLLDEPETALSPKTQIELLDLLTKLSAAGHAQFLIATHSPILMACPGATIYSFDHTPIARVPYAETDHYRVYRDFMSAPRPGHSSS